MLLIKGCACLTVEGNSEQVVLEEGDWLEIKAHVRHRVEWTAPDQDTVWLAVYYQSSKHVQSREKTTAVFRSAVIFG